MYDRDCKPYIDTIGYYQNKQDNNAYLYNYFILHKGVYLICERRLIVLYHSVRASTGQFFKNPKGNT